MGKPINMHNSLEATAAEPIPKDLAGFQNIVCGIVKQGDLLVLIADREPRDWQWAINSVGKEIIDGSLEGWANVYRRIPVPKQGDLREEAYSCTFQPSLKKIIAKTDDALKPPLAHLPWKALREVALVQSYGKDKYGDFHNYKLGMEVGRNLSCAFRHGADFMDGIDNDAESKRHALAHMAARCLFALENIIDGTAVDDRYKSP